MEEIYRNLCTTNFIFHPSSPIIVATAAAVGRARSTAIRLYKLARLIRVSSPHRVIAEARARRAVVQRFKDDTRRSTSDATSRLEVISAVSLVSSDLKSPRTCTGAWDGEARDRVRKDGWGGWGEGNYKEFSIGSRISIERRIVIANRPTHRKHRVYAVL